MTIRETRRDLLFDYAEAEPGGITVDDMVSFLGITHAEANLAIRDLRLFLGEYDEINFPCEPDPDAPKGRWVYRLVGTLDGIRWWASNRVNDAESRLRTMHSMMKSIVKGTDSRTIQGRKARVIELGLRHLVENLDNLAGEDALVYPAGATKQQIAGYKAAATRRANNN